MYLKIFCEAFCIAGLCAFFIGWGRVSGALEWLQARTPSFLPWRCNFCLGFWLSILFVILVTYFIEPFNWTMILVVLISTAINNALTK